MKVDNLNVSVPTDYDGKPITIVFREDSAASVNNPVRFAKKVSVQTIHEFIKGKKYGGTPKENTGVLMYNLQADNLGLEFLENPNDELATKLIANIELNPDFIAFGINKDRYFQGRQLINHCRKYAHCFAEPSQAQRLIAALQNFEIKFEQTHKKEDDRKGNAEEQIKSALKFVKGEVPTIWQMSMPLFKGAPNVEFSIEIEIEAQGGHPAFAFYSMEVELMLRETGTETIMNEVDKFKEQFTTLEIFEYIKY